MTFDCGVDSSLRLEIIRLLDRKLDLRGGVAFRDAALDEYAITEIRVS